MSMVTMRECKQKVLDWVSNYVITPNTFVIESTASDLLRYLNRIGADRITIEATERFDLDEAIAINEQLYIALKENDAC
jgi:hypothetical protein